MVNIQGNIGMYKLLLEDKNYSKENKEKLVWHIDQDIEHLNKAIKTLEYFKQKAIESNGNISKVIG